MSHFLFLHQKSTDWMSFSFILNVWCSFEHTFLTLAFTLNLYIDITFATHMIRYRKFVFFVLNMHMSSVVMFHVCVSVHAALFMALNALHLGG